MLISVKSLLKEMSLVNVSFQKIRYLKKDAENIKGCDIVFNDLISDFEYPHY